MANDPIPLRVDVFEWDDNNVAHLGGHNLAVDMVEEARKNNPLFLPNKPGRTATHVMIGVTDAGQLLYIAIVEVSPGLWRPITWESREARQVWNKYRG